MRPDSIKLQVQAAKEILENGNPWDGFTQFLKAQSLVEDKLNESPGNMDFLRFAHEIEHLVYVVDMKVPKKDKGPNMLRVTGSNINGNLGIGYEGETSVNVHSLQQF